MKDSWDPKIYAKFLALRTRPAQDLLTAIPNTFQPKTIYDLGCGPGNSTLLLKNRWPEANLIGVDSSTDMLKIAKASHPDITFIEGNIADFLLTEKVDCLFANASLQWLQHHEKLFPQLISALNAGGVLAVQMPNNFHCPSHQVTIRLLQEKSNWQSFLKNLRYGLLKKPFYELKKYYDLLTTSGLSSLALWETKYFQEMSNYEEIFNWVKGTALRPVLSVMNDKDQVEFAQRYINTISSEYPLQKNRKILLPFKRIFMIGFK